MRWWSGGRLNGFGRSLFGVRAFASRRRPRLSFRPSRGAALGAITLLAFAVIGGQSGSTPKGYSVGIGSDHADGGSTLLDRAGVSGFSAAELDPTGPDVGTLKLASETPIFAEDPAHEAVFNIDVGNGGTEQATDIELTDTLPGTGWSIAVNAGWDDCQISAGADDVLTCTEATLAVGPTLNVVVSRPTTTADCGDLDNTAQVSASNEPVANQNENNTSTATIVVQCDSDVGVLKLASETPIFAEDPAHEAVFTIDVGNAGPVTAVEVELTDTLPGTGWSILDNVGWDDCQISAGADDVLTCTAALLEEGPVLTVILSRPTTTADCGDLENTATVAAKYEPPAEVGEDAHENNTSTATIVVQCDSDVGVLKLASETPIFAEDPAHEAVFTIDVGNAGPVTAVEVELTDTLPGTGWSILDNVGWDDCQISAGADDVLTCTAALLEEGPVLTVILSRPTTTADCGDLENTATVAAKHEPPAEVGEDAHENNISTATIVVDCADLHVAKSAVATPIQAGQQVCFQITVSNAGPGSASDVTLTDPLPGSGWAISAADAGWTCNIAGNTLTCTAATLASGGSISVTVCRATAPADCGTLGNTATVSADNEPPADQNDNSSSAAVTVNCPQGSNQGCTPGFWSGGVGLQLWNTSPDAQWIAAGGLGDPPYIQTRLFNTFFTPHSSLVGLTMLQLVGTGGTSNVVRMAARDLVGAYLNASFGLSYPFTPVQLRAMWTAAVNNGSTSAFRQLHNTLDAANRLGCPLGRVKS